MMDKVMGVNLLIIIAVILDYSLGDPHSWPHPIIYIGNIISRYEKIIRKNKWLPLRFGGFILTGASIITVVIIISGILILAEMIHPLLKLVFTIYFLYTSLAAKCLHLEGINIYNTLKDKDINKSRKLLSYLVGRETDTLNFKEITRAVVETISENSIDGVLAPMFYIGIGFIFGIPVQMVFIYKTINTLDSMVGYIQEPYREIGYASAKLDDIANYIPARVGSVLMILSGIFLGYDMRNGFRILKRDRRNHKSPNCAYPESAVAGLLSIQLGGTNTYFGQKVYKPTIGDDIKGINIESIKDSIKIMYGSEILMLMLVVIINYIIML